MPSFKRLRFSYLVSFIPQQHRAAILRSLPYWLAATLTGLVAVAYAMAIENLTTGVSWLLKMHPWVLLAWSPLCFLLGRLLVMKFAPYAAGSGIPQVMAALEVSHDDSEKVMRPLFGKRVLAVKLSSSLLMIAGGAALGREGPMIQIATCLFYQVGKRFRRITPAISNLHAWVLAGGAAGIAAAFNTPLGGIVFAIEELVSPHFYKVKTSLIAAVIIAGMVAQAILGPYLYIGYPDIPLPNATSMLTAIFIGVMTGGGGGLFGKLLTWGTRSLRQLTAPRSLAFAALAGLMVAILGLCLGDRVLGGGLTLIRDLLFAKNNEHSSLMLIARYGASLISFMAGAAGGIFAPSLAIGAELGANLSRLLGGENHNLMVVLGMAGFLAALTHAPFTAFVLVIEMTNRHGIIFPLMLTSLTASFVSRLMGPSYYRHQCKYYLFKLHQQGLTTTVPTGPQAMDHELIIDQDDVKSSSEMATPKDRT